MGKLEDAIKDLNKKYKDSPAIIIGNASKNQYSIPSFKTNCPSLNEMFGCGGLPKGRVIEIFGEESSGKSSLAMYLASQVQRDGGKVVWIDAEVCFSSDYSAKMGINLEDLIVIQPESGEQALDTVRELTATGEIGLIVVDSVAALTPQKEIDGEISDQDIGVQARLMGKSLRVLSPLAAQNDTSIIFINQLRDKIGVFFGNKQTTPGGKSLKFFSSLRIEVKKRETIWKGAKEDKDALGNYLEMAAVKNKVGVPFKNSKLALYYNSGIDWKQDVFNFSEKLGLLTKTGNTYFLGEKKLGVGAEQAYKAITNEDVEFLLTEIDKKNEEKK